MDESEEDPRTRAHEDRERRKLLKLEGERILRELSEQTSRRRWMRAPTNMTSGNWARYEQADGA